MATTALTTTEHDDLQRLESQVERGLASFIEVGQALAAINERKLYRADHATFEQYLLAKWGVKRQRAYELMEASAVTRRLSENSDTPAPAREAHAAPLATLPPDEQREAWTEAVETAPKKNGKPHVTAAHVEKVVAKRMALDPEPPAAPPATDRCGRAIPTDHVRAAFEQRQRFVELTTIIARLKQSLHAIANDPVGVYILPQEIDDRTRDLRNLITYGTPYALCPYCDGGMCKACRHSGWMPEKMYEQNKAAGGAK